MMSLYGATTVVESWVSSSNWESGSGCQSKVVSRCAQHCEPRLPQVESRTLLVRAKLNGNQMRVPWSLRGPSQIMLMACRLLRRQAGRRRRRAGLAADVGVASNLQRGSAEQAVDHAVLRVAGGDRGGIGRDALGAGDGAGRAPRLRHHIIDPPRPSVVTCRRELKLAGAPTRKPSKACRASARATGPGGRRWSSRSSSSGPPACHNRAAPCQAPTGTARAGSRSGSR